ncbi:MAG: response regulator [Anaerolineales bacterium]|nr:response regulator [Anaerolineales bacterium]MCS7247054.1 response regulator [Anaerolineales bacterium]MDW8160865.1 response regulator [Anaerolineales bacterium]MDW8447367.1 response regulator [Anaerolineales bacterium]
MEATEKIRVVIVDDIAETRENIRKLLQFEKDIEVVGAAKNGREGIEITRQTKPDVVIMDINMPDMDGITATEAIRRANPYTQIVILSVQGDPNYMRRAMLAGARDFLTKPPSVDELTAAVRRAGKMAYEEREKIPPPIHSGVGGSLTGVNIYDGKVVVVYSPKGGVGTTTVATNLAVALHSSETPVVIVDGNLQFGDVAVFLNEQGKNSVVDLAPRVDELDLEVVESVLLVHKPSGVKVLAAPLRPEYAESVTGEQFAKVLQFLRKMFAYVVVDSSAYLSDVVLSAFDVTDVILLLTTQDIPAIKNARMALEVLDALSINRKRVLFVLNRYDKRIGITPEKIAESIKQEMVATIPFDERTVIPSVNRGIPFMLEDRTRPIAKAYLGLAELVRQRITQVADLEIETKKTYSGILGRVSR